MRFIERVKWAWWALRGTIPIASDYLPGDRIDPGWLARMEKPNAPDKGMRRPFNVAVPEEWVWIGDLSGFTVGCDHGPAYVYHRCGFFVDIEGSNEYLGNIVQYIVTPHRIQGCQP